MFKQLTPAAAIEAGKNGKDVVVIMTTPEHDKLKWVSLRDLLAGCIFLVDDWEVATIKQEKRGAKPRVDVSKVIELHNAGWSGVKIADELHISSSTVSRYILQWEDTKNGVWQN